MTVSFGLSIPFFVCVFTYIMTSKVLNHVAQSVQALQCSLQYADLAMGDRLKSANQPMQPITACVTLL